MTSISKKRKFVRDDDYAPKQKKTKNVSVCFDDLFTQTELDKFDADYQSSLRLTHDTAYAKFEPLWNSMIAAERDLQQLATHDTEAASQMSNNLTSAALPYKSIKQLNFERYQQSCDILVKYFTQSLHDVERLVTLKSLVCHVDAESTWNNCKSLWFPKCQPENTFYVQQFYYLVRGTINGNTAATIGVKTIKFLERHLIWQQSAECAKWIRSVEAQIQRWAALYLSFQGKMSTRIGYVHKELDDILRDDLIGGSFHRGEWLPSNSQFDWKWLRRRSDI
jgi:hypothetical protein